MPGPVGNAPRPYLSASIDKLIEIVEQNRTNTEELKRLLVEIHHRSTPRARKLRDRIRNLIAAGDQQDLLSKEQPEPVPSPPPKREARPPAQASTVVPPPVPGNSQAAVRNELPTQEDANEADVSPSFEDQDALSVLGVTSATEWAQVESKRRLLLRDLVPSKDLPEPYRLQRRKEADRINQAFLELFRSRCAPKGTDKAPPAAATDQVR